MIWNLFYSLLAFSLFIHSYKGSLTEFNFIITFGVRDRISSHPTHPMFTLEVFFFYPSQKKLILLRKENFGLSSWPKLNSKRHQCFRGQSGPLLPAGTSNLTPPATVHNSKVLILFHKKGMSCFAPFWKGEVTFHLSPLL